MELPIRAKANCLARVRVLVQATVTRLTKKYCIRYSVPLEDLGKACIVRLIANRLAPFRSLCSHGERVCQP